jgi:hypothetical protein
LLRNVYSWFVRVERGLYNLSEGAKAALKMLESIVASLDGGGDAGVACLLGELWAGFGGSPRDRALPLADFPQPPRGLRVLCLGHSNPRLWHAPMTIPMVKNLALV